MIVPYDLRSLADQHAYKTILDPTSEIESNGAERAWLTRIPCKHGHVAIHSATELSAFCTCKLFLKRLRAIPGTRRFLVGQSEFSCVFSPDALDAVCAILKARRRRQFTAEQRERLIAAGQQYRFAAELR